MSSAECSLSCKMGHKSLHNNGYIIGNYLMNCICHDGTQYFGISLWQETMTGSPVLRVLAYDIIKQLDIILVGRIC